MSDDQRHSVAEEVRLLTDPDAIAAHEAENALRQFDRTLDLIDDVARGGRPFRLRPSIILDLHRIALDGLSPYAGNFRPGSVEIGKSSHSPPPSHRVFELIEEMCDTVNDMFRDRSALHLCAYVMWRLNWIHPFTDGNGRTSRALAYFVLCARLGYRLPGHRTVPEQIAADKNPYYLALEAADQEAQAGSAELTELKTLLETCLAAQLLSALNDATDPAIATNDSRRFH